MLRLGLGFLYDWSACAMLPPCEIACAVSAVAAGLVRYQDTAKTRVVGR